MEPAGEGVLKQRYEALKKKLLAEGLFDEDRKQGLPALPRRIGVITSPSGAAIRDVVSVLGRRFPSVPVIVYPAAVQGDAAPGELVAALETAIERDECDVLIIGRGGGSLEDLWAFNDEAWRALSPTVPSRSSARLATRWILQFATSSPMSAPRRRRVPQRSWCPTSMTGYGVSTCSQRGWPGLGSESWKTGRNRSIGPAVAWSVRFASSC